MNDTITKKLEWAALWDAMDLNPAEWIETTENMYWQQLECVPPVRHRNGAFLVGEPESHNAAGEAVYACFKRSGDNYFAKYLTAKQFDNGLIAKKG